MDRDPADRPGKALDREATETFIECLVPHGRPPVRAANASIIRSLRTARSRCRSGRGGGGVAVASRLVMLPRVSVLLTTLALAGIVAACGSDAVQSGTKEVKDGTFRDLPGFVVEDGAPSNAPKLFAKATGEAAAPCLTEPEPGTLYPKNVLPPRFSWTAATEANLFELRVTAKNQAKDLVVYTTESTWTMPEEMWNGLREHSADVAMSVEVRGAVYEDGALHDVTEANGGDLGIAPVDAPGSIVFWSILKEDSSSLLKGLTLDKPGVVDVLRSKNISGNAESPRTCIGCHTATPDGKYVAVAFEAGELNTGLDLARIEKGTTAGPRPSYVSAAAGSRLDAGYPMLSTFSRAHWTAGDRVMLTNEGGDLAWVDLEAKSPEAARGLLGSTGDRNLRRMGPSWSRDGASIVYMSGKLGENPFELEGPSDLYVMPYANKAGASATSPAKPLPGASDPGRAEYYPALSPDDRFVAFTSIPDNGKIYDNAQAEVFVIPREGGERVRLAANDPPTCAPKRSPGITNSWPKWAPEFTEHEGRRFYFVVFSSKRHRESDRPQLYIAPIKVDGEGITTYPAVYLRNPEGVPNWQAWGNHTPAWDVFEIEAPIVK
jgi:hypothetical protein